VIAGLINLPSPPLEPILGSDGQRPFTRLGHSADSPGRVNRLTCPVALPGAASQEESRIVEVIPVALDRLQTPVAIAYPEPRTPHCTGEILTGHDGNPLWTVAVSFGRPGTRTAVMMEITTAVEPVGIIRGTPLRIINLDAVPWALHGYTGVFFRAAQILPGNAPVRRPTESLLGAASRREN
jgi:hypothetical protein